MVSACSSHPPTNTPPAASLMIFLLDLGLLIPAVLCLHHWAAFPCAFAYSASASLLDAPADGSSRPVVTNADDKPEAAGTSLSWPVNIV